MMNTTKKGDSFENQVFDIIKDLIDDGSFFISQKTSKIYKKKAYFSKDRGENIITDISIETFIKKAENYSLLTILECKNLSKPVPVDDIEEFDSKLRQIGEHNIKGILISKSGYQKGALAISRSKGIGLINIKKNKEVEWVNFRKDATRRSFDQSSIEKILYDVNLLENNFFASYNSKTFDFFPFLLIELGVLDFFENKPKYIIIPYLKENQISEVVDPFMTYNLYNDDSIDFDKTCQFLSEKMGIRFEFNQLMPLEILGKINFNPLQIQINPNLKSEKYRWRFTLAHEIGHLILHKEYLEAFLNENIDIEEHINLNLANSIRFNKRLEIQANLFASELLIPRKPLFKYVKDYFEAERIYKGSLYLDNQPCNKSLVYNFLRLLQLKFEVSLEVARIRLVNLKLLEDTTDNSIKNIMKKLI